MGQEVLFRVQTLWIGRRQDAVDHFDPGPGGPAPELHHVGDDVQMGDHDALGQPGRSAGVGQVSQVFPGIDRDFFGHGLVLLKKLGQVQGIRNGRLGNRLQRRQNGVETIDQTGGDDAFDRGVGNDAADPGVEQVHGNQGFGPGIVELIGHLPGTEHRAQGREHGPDPHGAVIGHWKLRAVQKVNGDPVPLFHAKVFEGRGEPLA